MPGAKKKVGRPPSFGPLKLRVTISVSEEVYGLVAEHPNRSAYISELILLDSGKYDDPATLRKVLRLRESIEEAERDREDAEARLSKHQEELDQVEAETGRQIELTRAEKEAAREKVLGIFLKKKVSEKDILGWFESPGRADTRRECGFKSPKEAAAWVLEHMDQPLDRSTDRVKRNMAG